MSYGLNSYQRKNRQKARMRLLLQGLVLLAVVAFSAFSYSFGERQMSARIAQQMDEVAELKRDRESLHKQVIDLQAADLVNQQKIADLEALYRREIPDEAHAGLVRLMRDRIAAGVTVDRMGIILAAAENPRNCRGREGKRFMLSTPLNQGTNSSATFGGGAVTVSGDGQTSTAPDGKAEAWYDPGKPVSMKFRLIGGHVSVAEGILPLQHTVIDDTTEYRFTVEAGPRGFVTVTSDLCDYPGAAPAPEIPAVAPSAGDAALSGDE